VSSWATSDSTRRSMVANRGRDTAPELLVRRAIHARGLRYRVNARPLPDLRRTADLVFRRARVAVFIDGCFWHQCPQHGSIPKLNEGYWAPKLARNVERDRETDDRLENAGWLVIRVWEHEDTEAAVRRIEKAVRERGRSRR
jgi:DNA mismatch endonuclease (patch repair protein)